jgi:thiol-disulfide isomerase/thioredoxin
MILKSIKLLFFLFVLQASVFAYASEPKQTTITCRVHNDFSSSVSLYKIENGNARRVSFRWTKNDSCVFSLPIEKDAVYFLGKSGGAHGTNYSYVLYLKPGENKTVDLYSSKASLDFDSCNIDDPNVETKLLQKWTNIVNKYCKLGSNKLNREVFISEYDNFVRQGEQLKKKAANTNSFFRHLCSSKINADVKYCKLAAFFNFAERMNYDYDTITSHKSFYQSLSNENFCDGGLLNSEHGLQTLNYQLTFDLFQQSGSKEIALNTSVNDKARSLCNDTVRGAFLTQYLAGVTNYEQFVAEIEPFKNSFVTASMKEAYAGKLKQLNKYVKGSQAYNFSLYDTKEQLHSLSDFKGRVVVLDVWAMWCAPCLAEKPYFTKLEEEYKDRSDIIFVGVSVDGNIKKDAWKNFVTKKGWKNIELLSNFDESIMKYYNIDGIPRFMIFDREGKIITIDAPRPSDPSLRELIEQTLKSNS